jgi:hypothetical protein
VAYSLGTSLATDSQFLAGPCIAEWHKTLGRVFRASPHKYKHPHNSNYHQVPISPPSNPNRSPTSVSTTSGNILQLGPPAGSQLPSYNLAKVTHIYGIEPNAAFMDPLRNKMTETGLEGKYTLINCGIKDVEILREYGIVEGSTDCVVSMQVICSVEKPEEAVKGVGGC